MKRYSLAYWFVFSFGFLLLLAGCQSKRYVALTTGDWHACALTDHGEVDCWGDNGHGQVGSGGDYSFSLSPVTVKGVTDVKALSAGGDHTCALTVAGSLFCWGNNSSGQLGDGGTVVQSPAVTVKAQGLQFQSVSAGEAFTCGLTVENAVYCWGKNDLGQLGNGTSIDSALPVKVSGLPVGAITRLESQGAHTCVWLQGGSIWCWGQNLLEKTRQSNLVPVQITASQPQFQSVVEQDNFACLLTPAGAVQCWGRNAEGELGTGDTQESDSPVPVQGLSAAVNTIALGDSFGCALTQSGIVKCWGNNQFSQLGDGTTNGRTAPADVSGLESGIKALSAGHNFACALSDAGQVSCWGTIDNWNSSLPHRFQ